MKTWLCVLARIRVLFLDEELLRFVLVLTDIRRVAVDQLVTVLSDLAECSVLSVSDPYLRLPTNSCSHCSCL